LASPQEERKAHIDSTALYYTFSTIAQTLAAGFAVLAAFVLYRLQGIETEFSQANSVFAQLDEYITMEEIWRVLLTEGFESLDAQLSAIEKERYMGLYTRSLLEHPSRSVLLWWPIWKVTVRWLRVSLWTTVMDVGWCFVALPCVPYLAASPWLAWTSSVVAVIAGLVAISVYTRVIFLLLAPARLSPFSG